MFQTFRAAVANEGQDPSSARLSRLRAELSRLRVDAFLVPRADEHLGEYVPPSAERLRWVSGFSGSAGLAIVTAEAAALLVDGRYTVQARQEVDGGAIEVLQTPAASASAWLAAKLPAGAVVGFDSRLHPVAEIERLTTALSDHRITLKALAASSASLGGRVRGSAASPLDVAWGSAQPAPPLAKAVPHPLEYAGREAREKIAAVQAVLRDAGQDAVVLTIPDSICWLFNIRGQDVAHNPVVLAHAIVPADGPAELFIAPEKVDRALKAHLGRRVVVSPPSVLAERLAALRSDGRKVRVDPASASVWIARQLGGAGRIVRGSDPCVLPKAIKNVVEIEGARRAHVRDGAAMVRFLAWLAQQQPGKGLDEITVVERLEACRRETGALREISFDTISGSGPNGAIVHYRVNEASNRKIGRGELLLVDSGGQYADGTTDITRTMAIGMPTAEMRNRYTRVLKGHVALSMARFPVGTRGIDLDPLVGGDHPFRHQPSNHKIQPMELTPTGFRHKMFHHNCKATPSIQPIPLLPTCKKL